MDNQNLTPQETAEQEAAAKAQWRDSKAKLKLAKAEEKLTREQQMEVIHRTFHERF